jgi:prolyl 4-hydroxylase
MRKEELDGFNIFVVHDFLSPEECEHFIRLTEERGYTDAPITTSFGPMIRKDVRNNERVMLDDFALARELWEKARPFVPSRLFEVDAVGLNERFRFYRYDVGQQFAQHMDGCFDRGHGERSELTFMVYLNDGFEGGRDGLLPRPLGPVQPPVPLGIARPPGARQGARLRPRPGA